MADWLNAYSVDTVAMESTSVYWIPSFQLLESHGFKVFLVNTYGLLPDAYFRRMCGRMDNTKAVTAVAYKLAPDYVMLTKDEVYTDQGRGYYEVRFCERAWRQLAQRAEK